MAPDLYEILEVSRNASAPVIKAAYRCLVQSLHPDRNPHDSGAAARLVDINRAYAVIGDAQRRAEYDISIGLVRDDRRGNRKAFTVSRTGSGGQPGVRMFAFRPID